MLLGTALGCVKGSKLKSFRFVRLALSLIYFKLIWMFNMIEFLFSGRKIRSVFALGSMECFGDYWLMELESSSKFIIWDGNLEEFCKTNVAICIQGVIN